MSVSEKCLDAGQEARGRRAADIISDGLAADINTAACVSQLKRGFWSSGTAPSLST